MGSPKFRQAIDESRKYAKQSDKTGAVDGLFTVFWASDFTLGLQRLIGDYESMPKLLASDIDPIFHMTNDKVLFAANLVNYFYLYDQICIATNSLKEIELLRRLIEDTVLMDLMARDRLVFMFEPAWGVAGQLSTLDEDIRRGISISEFRRYVGYSYQRPGGNLSYDDLVRNIENSPPNEPLRLAMQKMRRQDSYENTVKNVKTYIDQAVSSVEFGKRPIASKEQFFKAIELTKQRAFLIRDLSHAKLLSAHVDLDFKSKWWGIRQDLKSLTPLPGTTIGRKVQRQSLYDFPNLYHTISENITTPSKLIAASNADWAIDYRIWFESEINSNAQRIQSPSYFTKILDAIESNTRILRWAALTAVSFVPIIGHFISAAAEYHHAKEEHDRDHLWRPRLYLDTQVQPRWLKN